MARKRYKPEEIVARLRQVDVLVSQGQSVDRKNSLLGVPESPAPRLKIPCYFRAETRPRVEKLG